MKSKSMKSNINKSVIIATVCLCLATSGCGGGAEEKKLEGRWQGKVMLFGQQGIAEMQIDFGKGRAFDMLVVAAESAHTLNAYPTLDRIQFKGKWSKGEDGEILLEGRIESFVRRIKTGGAASHGWLPDDSPPAEHETALHPLEFEDAPVLRFSEDGGLFLSLIQFRGEVPGESNVFATTRSISAMHLTRVDPE